MPRIGAHMSIAGGLPLALERARTHGCESLQIFSRSSNQWRTRALPPDECARFKEQAAESGIAPIVSHASYLINLAAAAAPLRRRSLVAFGDELDRAEALGLLGVVIHPGSYTDGTEEGGLQAIADAVSGALADRTDGGAMVLLEQTAGQGTALGWSFEQLADLLRRLHGDRRVGVCLDTCHLFAAGYDLATVDGYRKTFEAFEQIVGLDRLKVIHVNDSKKPCGSRVDRHEHIGRGTLGLDAFRRLIGDPRFSSLPMVLETPKTEGHGRDPLEPDPLDVMNLAALRGLREGR
jgi:deoxyribonuclease-4